MIDLKQMDRLIDLSNADLAFLLFLGDFLKDHGLSLSQLLEAFDEDM